MDKPSVSPVWRQWEVLLDKSHRRFNKLQQIAPGLPQAAYVSGYIKTAALFSKLWKYQQDNRAALMNEGLRRSEVGEIASKIGQMYYQYYLRTGDTSQLVESYVFYEALHSRQYFADSVNSLHLAVKQLRFIARFIVVCLLLSKKEEAWNLLQEFNAALSAYVLRFSPGDGTEWQRVLDEITAFMHSEVAMPVPRSPGSAVPFKALLRVRPGGPEVACAPHSARLREAVLASYHPRQVKVAELPVDMFRMVQSLEWQDAGLNMLGTSDDTSPAGAPASATGGAGTARTAHTGASGPTASAGTNTGVNGSGPSTSGDGSRHICLGTSAQAVAAAAASSGTPRNPSRNLLYKPTFQTLMSVLLSNTTALGPDDIMLLYLSASAPPGMAPRSSTAATAAAPAALPVPSAPATPVALSAAPDAAVAGSSVRPSITTPAVVPLMLAPIPVGGAGCGTANGVSSGQGGAQGGAVVGVSSQPPRPLACDGLLYPDELMALTRRRLFVIVDSDAAPGFLAQLAAHERERPACHHPAATAISATPPTTPHSHAAPNGTAPVHSHPGHAARQPLLVLASPPAGLPTSLDRPDAHGSLFTLALTSPLMAMCLLAGQTDPSPQQLRDLQTCLDESMAELGAAMARTFAPPPTATAAPAAAASGTSPLPDGPAPPAAAAPRPLHTAWAPWSFAFGDAMLRRFMLHFAFFRCALSLHADSHNSHQGVLPSCHPPLPPCADTHDALLEAAVRRCAAVLGKQALFMRPPPSSSSTAAAAACQPGMDGVAAGVAGLAVAG